LWGWGIIKPQEQIIFSLSFKYGGRELQKEIKAVPTFVWDKE
jgi:hypothetical protein